MTAREPSPVEVIAEVFAKERVFVEPDHVSAETARMFESARLYVAEHALAALKAAGFVVATRDEIRAMSPTDNGSWRFVSYRPMEMP